MKYILLILFSFRAICGEMVILNKGQEAPFSGILSDQAQMAEFRKTNEENKLLNLQNIKLKDLADIGDQRIELYKEEIKVVRSDLSSSEKKRFWSNMGYFALGVLVTGLAAKVAIEATR